MSSDKCEYCERPAPVISRAEENEIGEDVRVCGVCMNLLKDPATALPLIRGHLSIEGRHQGPHFRNRLEDFMGVISKWKTRTKH